MALDPNDVVRWSPVQWMRSVRMIRPSDGGAQGVLFVFTKEVPNWSFAQADFIVKPVQGSAANTVFAEEILSKTVGAKKLDTHGIRRDSLLGGAILDTVQQFLQMNPEALDNAIDTQPTGPSKPSNRPGKGVQRNETEQATRMMSKVAKKPAYPYHQRLASVQKFYREAGSFLIQRLAVGMQELGDVYRTSGGLSQVLQNFALMKNLGRLFAADAVLGNGDRIQQMNTGNIAFGGDGTVFAIDSTTIMASFNSLIYDSQKGTNLSAQGYANPESGKLTKDGWAHGTMMNGGAAATRKQVDDYQKALKSAQIGVSVPAPVLPVAASMELIFNPPAVWQLFRREMEYKLRDENKRLADSGQPALPSPPATDWENARQHFIDGVLDGLARVDNLLSGFSWLRIKSDFKSLEKKHGKDLNMDYTNFKMRRMIVHLCRKGVPVEQARLQAVAYAERKLKHFPSF